jgi:uncharacterized protein (DUF1330 family)
VQPISTTSYGKIIDHLMKEEHMAAYVIASVTIKDAARFEEYRRTLLPSMEKYGARLVARGGPIVLEGEWPRERLIIAEFPSTRARVVSKSD